MLRGETDTCPPRSIGRDERTPQIAMSEVHDLRVRIQNLGDGFVLGVVFPGQLQVRRGKLKLALGFELGAQAVPPCGGLGYTPANVAG
jgi:hypothetical protein